MAQTNVAENYRWTPAEIITVKSDSELIAQLDKCYNENIPVRVMASGWSCNKFIDPNPTSETSTESVHTENDSAALSLNPGTKGINIVLRGDYLIVQDADFEKNTVYAGAGAQREAVYEKLNKFELEASGECFLTKESQEVGALIANAVHDTMQRAFTPETVPHIKAAVFENGKTVIKDFDKSHGDLFYAFFGGVGMTGIILGATLKITAKTYYHKLVYLPGVDFVDSFIPNHEPPVIKEHYPISFADAVIDLKLKHCFRLTSDTDHTCCKRTKDIAACFVQFNVDPEIKEEGKEYYPTEINYNLSRYYQHVEGGCPEGKVAVSQDKSNDYCADLANEYVRQLGGPPDSTDSAGADDLTADVIAVQTAVANIKYKYANWTNENQQGFPHWAYYESGAAHTTGPFYVHLWAKAVEFYIKADDMIIKQFCEILEISLRKNLLSPTTGISKNAASLEIFADCRYAYSSDTAFMSGFYNHDALVIDIGCTKHHGFTNEKYTIFVTEVLSECFKANIDVRIHTGKFFIYDDIVTKKLYSTECRERIRNVAFAHDPTGIFSSSWMRNLFF